MFFSGTRGSSVGCGGGLLPLFMGDKVKNSKYGTGIDGSSKIELTIVFIIVATVLVLIEFAKQSDEASRNIAVEQAEKTEGERR